MTGGTTLEISLRGNKVLCILYYVFCILYSVLCIMYSVFCILYSVFCILYLLIHGYVASRHRLIGRGKLHSTRIRAWWPRNVSVSRLDRTGCWVRQHTLARRLRHLVFRCFRKLAMQGGKTPLGGRVAPYATCDSAVHTTKEVEKEAQPPWYNFPPTSSSVANEKLPSPGHVIRAQSQKALLHFMGLCYSSTFFWFTMIIGNNRGGVTVIGYNRGGSQL